MLKLEPNEYYCIFGFALKRECHTPGPKLYAGPKPNPVFKPHPVLKANARSKQNLNLNEIQNRSNSRMDLDESNTTLSSVLR